MIDLKEIFPFEAIAPMIGGAVVWFGANYIFIGPEVIGPRLQEKYFAPMCTQVVQAGRTMQGQKEKALVNQFEARMEDYANSVRRQAQNGAQGFFGMFGAEGHAFWNKYGNQLGGGIASATEGPLRMRMDQERNTFYSKLEEERAKAKASLRFTSADAYCGCVIGEALGERFDLAAYSASLRFYTPPSIRNIENGSVFAESDVCGPMPII